MPSTGGAFRCLTTSLALTATLVCPLSSSIAQSGGTVLGNVLDENGQVSYTGVGSEQDLLGAVEKLLSN